jgi:ATP-dependent protease ClpP protease subunit
VTITFKAKGKKSAEIMLYGDVGEGWFGGISAATFGKELRALGQVDEIDLRINSIGGDVFDGMAIYRLLVDHQARITTHVDGTAASIASVIAMAGDEILIGESASMMIHNAWGIGVGNAADLRALADRMERESTNIADVYASRSGKDRSHWMGLMAAETWFYGQEAVDAGLATRVVENLKMAAHGSRTAWASHMRGRLLEHAARGTASAETHPANDDVRAQVAALSDRVRASRAAHRSRGAGT